MTYYQVSENIGSLLVCVNSSGELSDDVLLRVSAYTTDDTATVAGGGQKNSYTLNMLYLLLIIQQALH